MFGISVGGAISVGLGAAGLASSYSSSKTQSKNMEAQYQQDVANYAIQKEYHGNLVAFAGEQQAFAYQQLAYANEQYQVGLANIAAETAYREKAVYNTKLAKLTDYNAKLDTALLLQGGAEASLVDTVNESLRVDTHNKREINKQATKAMGTAQAMNSGITGGKSRGRQMVDIFMQRNAAVGQIEGKTRQAIITASRQKDKVVNDTNLGIFENFREVEAVMRLEAQPVAQIAGPMPVFTGIPPVAPLSAPPVAGATSSPWAAGAAAATSGINTGLGIYNALPQSFKV